MTKWNDPELGDFEFDRAGWVKPIHLPSFKAFSYRSHGRNVGRSKIEFEFEAADETEDPSKQAITIAKRIVKNPKRLADRIVKAVWNDLRGKGKDSGMWWHGDTATINEMIDLGFEGRKPKRLQETNDLFHLIGCPSIWIRESIWLYEKPSATIMFEAAFDVEHGLGVLTDGNRVLGTGHQTSVSPFFEEQFFRDR